MEKGAFGMSVVGDVAHMRVATVGFAPPPPINRLSSLNVIDIDFSTGERSRTPITGSPVSARQRQIQMAFERLILLEWAKVVGVEMDMPPSWVPDEEQALADLVRVTSGPLFELLSSDGVEPETVDRNEAQKVSGAHYALPTLFMRVAIAIEKVKSGLTLAEAHARATGPEELIAPTRLIEEMRRPLAALNELFGLKVDTHDKLGGLYLSARCDRLATGVREMGEVSDLMLVAALVWAANLVTSEPNGDADSIVFWLTDQDGEAFGGELSLPMRRSGKSVEIDLSISNNIGTEELQVLDEVITILGDQCISPAVFEKEFSLEEVFC